MNHSSLRAQGIRIRLSITALFITAEEWKQSNCSPVGEWVKKNVAIPT